MSEYTAICICICICSTIYIICIRICTQSGHGLNRNCLNSTVYGTTLSTTAQCYLFVQEGRLVYQFGRMSLVDRLWSGLSWLLLSEMCRLVPPPPFSAPHYSPLQEPVTERCFKDTKRGINCYWKTSKSISFKKPKITNISWISICRFPTFRFCVTNLPNLFIILIHSFSKTVLEMSKE